MGTYVPKIVKYDACGFQSEVETNDPRHFPHSWTHWWPETGFFYENSSL